jgi:hypothetical protein
VDQGLAPSLEWLRKQSELGWLAWSLDQARLRAYDDNQLLGHLDRGIPKPERNSVLREIERRINEKPVDFREDLVVVLGRIAQRHVKPGPAAQETDRLLRRLLWQLPTDGARTLALSCATSNRLQRRIAAWRFYSTHGLDAEARSAIAPTVETGYHEFLLKLVAHDGELLDRVGHERTLAAAPDAYWRGRVLETLLASGKTPVGLLESHPSEALFAIRRAEREDLDGLASWIFHANPSDPEVISAAIQAFGSLGLQAKLGDAVRAGQELLERVPEPEREWMRLTQSLKRLIHDPLDEPDESAVRAARSHPEATLW